MVFDFVFCSLGYPAMEMSFFHGFWPMSSKIAYIPHLAEYNFEIDTADKVFSSMVEHSPILRTLLILRSMRGAHRMDKIEFG